MNILVTGGAGFIGSNFILYWFEHHPHDFIVNIDALTYAGNLENLSSIENKENYLFIHANICNRPLIKKTMEDNTIDIVVHFAAESHVDRSILNSSPFIQTNIVGTHVLLDCALQCNIKRFHHISTDEVFGSLELGSSKKFTDTTPYDPRSPYSASKAASDHLVRSYYHTYKLPITISNCSNNYGPFQFPEKLIPLAITNIIERKKVPIYGDGLNVRDWLYVEDHIRAIELILEKGTIGKTYLVGGLYDHISNLDLVKKIIEYMKADYSQIQFVKDRLGHDRRYAIDWTTIERELGWKPKYTLDKGLQKTIEWYKEHMHWWKRIKSGDYQKYYHTQYDSMDVV